MEATEEAEKRFERAMERLFAGSALTKAARLSEVSREKEGGGCSSAGASPSLIGSKEDQRGGVVPLPCISGLVAPAACRPWDRSDLLHRLATYKSMTWFGKPQVAGPVACARRGWVNVDVDLLACEVCGARLSFPVPPSWPHQQVESAAQAFAEQLDTAHKGLCAWKSNACADMLAQFPPTPLPALLGTYADRCEALLQLSALPVVSESAINQMKLSRSPQIDHLLAQPPPLIAGLPFGLRPGSNSSGEGLVTTMPKTFYQAQRLIAVCGWEPRLLPYTVDCEDRSAAQSARRNGHTVPESFAARDPGPSVMVHSRGENLQDKGRTHLSNPDVTAFDPASAVLDCSLCGASIGLWSFATVARPSPLLDLGMAELPGPPKKLEETGIAGASAASCIDGWGLTRPELREEPRKDDADAVTVIVASKPVNRKGALDLNLTIAGGPPPTQLTAPAKVPPVFGPIPSIQRLCGHPEASETGDWVAASYESRGPQHWECGTDHGGSTVDATHYGRLAADSVEGTMVDHHDAEDMDDEGKDAAHSSKRKAGTALVERELVLGSHNLCSRKRKRKEPSLQGPATFVGQSSRQWPWTSSVNAIDTCYQQKQENSMESVENLPQESDGQGTAVNHEDGQETVVQADVSRCHHDVAEPGLSKSDEGGAEEGAETNLAVISTGTRTGGGVSVGMGGGGSVGMGGSDEAEIQGESVAGDAEFVMDMTGQMGETVPDRGYSQEVLLGINCALLKEMGSAGESGESQGKGSHRGENEHTKVEGTQETTDAVIHGGDEDPNPFKKEVGDSQMDPEFSEEKGRDIHGPTGHLAATGKKGMRDWKIDTGEFDPIHQHRHFCPWVNGHVAAAGSNGGSAGPVCGWQLTLDALQQQQPPAGLAESESTASMVKVNPLVSVCKLLGPISPPKQHMRSRIQS